MKKKSMSIGKVLLIVGVAIALFVGYKNKEKIKAMFAKKTV